MRKKSDRRGYALMLVLVSLVLFLSLWSIAYRMTSSALRVESVRAQNQIRDQGSIQAVARTLTLLETGSPPSDPYIGEMMVTTPTGVCYYTVTLSSEGLNNWKVSAAPMMPGTTPRLMPSTFGPAN